MKWKTAVTGSGFIIIGLVSLYSFSLHAQTQSSPKAQVPANVRFVAAGIANAREQIRCVRAAVVYHESNPQEWLEAMRSAAKDKGVEMPGLAVERRLTAQWYHQNSRFAMLIQPGSEDADTWRYQHLVVGDEHERYVQKLDDKKGSKGGVYYLGSVSPLGTSLKNGRWEAWSFMDPRSYAYFYGKWPLDKLLLENNPPPVFKGEATVEGSRCMKIELSRSKDSRQIFWFDAEHGFLLRRMETYHQMNDKMILDEEMRVPEVVESNGVWLPATVEIKNFVSLRGDSEKAQGVPKPFIFTRRVTVSDFQADCALPPEVFTLSWPLGTNITDTISQKRLVVVAVDAKELSALNHLHREAKQPELEAAAIREQDLTALKGQRKEQGLLDLKDPVAVALDEKDLAALDKMRGQQRSKPVGTKKSDQEQKVGEGNANQAAAKESKP